MAARLAARCVEVDGAGRDLVAELVADLYADGIDPALATEALIRSGCGAPGAIVREVVARGGDRVVLPVVDRAVKVQGPASVAAMERAAASGLSRWRRAADPEAAGRETAGPERAGLEPEPIPSPLAGANLSTAMVYFPLAGRVDAGERSVIAKQPFGSTAPEFGVYTFVLFGDVDASGGHAGIDTGRELLRVIETYVLAADGTAGDATGPNALAHGFMVPVEAGRDGATLLDQTDPELSAPMRGRFAAYLRAGGQLELAQRLERDSGPFLVSSLEPTLVPADPAAPRMLVDLSAIGPEYMYSIVDAYDRPIPTDQVGSIEGLAAIRARLMDLFPEPAGGATGGDPGEHGLAQAAPPAGWVYLFGRQQAADLDPPSAAPARSARVGWNRIGSHGAEGPGSSDAGTP